VPGAPDSPPTSRTLATLWTAAAGAIVLLAAVVLMTSDASSTVPAWLPVALTVAVAAGAVAAVVAVDRSLAAAPPADDEAALAELRTRAFLQLAILEAPVLLGVALGFTLGPPSVAAVGAAGGLAALAVTAPSRRRMARFDAAWHRLGHDVSLLRAERTVPPA
jgi:predicted MFS family arabinose efflux permease